MRPMLWRRSGRYRKPDRRNSKAARSSTAGRFPWRYITIISAAVQGFLRLTTNQTRLVVVPVTSNVDESSCVSTSSEVMKMRLAWAIVTVLMGPLAHGFGSPHGGQFDSFLAGDRNYYVDC